MRSQWGLRTELIEVAVEAARKSLVSDTKPAITIWSVFCIAELASSYDI